MNPKTFRVLFILTLIFLVSCNTATQNLPTATFQPPTAEATSVPASATSPPTITPTQTTLPPLTIWPDNLDQLQLLHDYWTTIGVAAEPYVDDDYEWLYYDPEVVALAITYSPDGRYIAVGGCTKGGYHGGGSGRAWCGYAPGDSRAGTAKPLGFVVDARTEEVIAVLPEYGEYATITDLAFTHDGKKLLIATDHLDADVPGKLEVWDIASQQVETVLWQDGLYPHISISPDDRLVAINEYRFDRLIVLNLSNGEIIFDVPLEPPRGHTLTPFTQFSADGRQLASHDHLNGLAIYDTTTGEQTAYFTLPCEEKRCFMPSPDLTLVATAASSEEQASVLIWDIKTGEQIQILPGIEGESVDLSFTPDGKTFLQVSDDGIFSAWTTADWQFVGDRDIFPDDMFYDSFPGRLQFADDGRSFLLEGSNNLYVFGLP